MAASKSCSKSGCPDLTQGGASYCSIHTLARPSSWHTSTRRSPGNWKTLVKAVKRRDRAKCRICKEKGSVVDHLLPTKWGGNHGMTNLRLMCSACHAKKTTDESTLGRRLRKVSDQAEYDSMIRDFIARWRA